MIASIIITSYNYDSYIEECIDSCIHQESITDYEIIVIDDGSTDNTYEILKKYRDNRRIRIFKNKNGGIENASNFGIKNSSGKYIVRVDADDTLAKDYLAKAVSEIENKDTSFVYSDYNIIDEQSIKIGNMKLPAFDKKEILKRGDFLATATLYKKSILDEIGLYNESVKNCGLENYELLINLLMKSYNGVHINEELFSYRRHQKNMSELKKNMIIEYGNNLFKKFQLGQYTTNQFHPYGLVIND